MDFRKNIKDVSVWFYSLIILKKMAKGILLIISQKNAKIDTLFLLLNSEIAYIIVVAQQFTVRSSKK